MSEKGFTLIEMAIIVLIIGVLMGGILKGRTLIDNSRSKKIITDVSSFIDAQNRFYTANRRYAGDSDNNGVIDFTTLNGATLDGVAASSADADFSFNELKAQNLLGTLSNAIISTTQNNGVLYYAGTLLTDSAGNSIPTNMVVVRGVTCNTAFIMEQSMDNDSPATANSAATGKVRFISGTALLTSGAWTAANICASNSALTTNIAVLFGTF